MRQNSFQKASQSKLPPQPNLDLLDPLEVKNTRFSTDRKHRYTLFRHWGDSAKFCVFIGMNPSGADEDAVDRTVDRCISFARDWGYGALYMLNTFSLRATDSNELMKSIDRLRSKNDIWIREIILSAPRVIAAWGEKGATRGRGKQVDKILLENCDPDRVFCFGRNKGGSPKHPLYQPANQETVPYFEKSERALHA
jgi:hypothetical protein